MMGNLIHETIFEYRMCPHCNAENAIIENEPPPEVCKKCRKSLLMTITPTQATDKPQTARLLDEGRKILADREALGEQAADEHRKEMNALWEQARLKALNLFAPIGGELIVQPTLPADDWDPNFAGQHNVRFYVRPSIDSGCIIVRLRGHSPADKPKWTWEREDKRTTFYIERQFRAAEGDELCVFGESFDETNSLAEALALCEKHAKHYRQVREARVARLVRIKEQEERANSEERPPTVDEDLLAALNRWHNSVTNQDDE